MSEEQDKMKAQRLTLTEMIDILKGNAYKKWHRFIQEDVNGEERIGLGIAWHNSRFFPLLYRHIVAEELLKYDYKEVDWKAVGLFDACIYFAFVDLLMHPLIWTDALEYEDVVIEGRIAEEEYDSERFEEIVDLLNHVNKLDIVDFANNPYEYKEDDYELKHVKGMHEWGRLTHDMEDIFHKIINGGHTSYEEIRNAKYYDLASLRYRLTVTAKECGGKRAGELLRMLQDEWPKIKLWKTYFDTMTPEDVEHFENGLFHGFDDLLEEWEAGNDAPKEQPKTVKRAKNQSVSKSQSFETLLQCPQDQKEHVMSRLHELLDNKGGKHVAMILMAAKQKYFLLLDIPTEKQYTAEFTLNGTWRAVSDYIQKHTLPSGKYSEDLDHISIL